VKTAVYGEYGLYGVFKPLLRDVEGYPRGISEVLWCQEGDNDGWLLLCGAFVYFTAWCDTAGCACTPQRGPGRHGDDRRLPRRPLSGCSEGWC